MRSISNNLLASEQPIVKQMTDDSLQELNRLQAVAAALQERPDDEVDTTELEEFDDNYNEEEQLLAELEDDSFSDYTEEDEEQLEADDDAEYFDDELDGFDEEYDTESVEQTATEDDVDAYFDDALEDTDTVEDITVSSDVSTVPTVAANAENVVTNVDEEDDFLDDEEDGFFDEEEDSFVEDDTAYDEDDGFFDEEEDVHEQEVKPSVKQPITSTPLVPPGLQRPIASIPLVPPGLQNTVQQTTQEESLSTDDELDLLDEMDADDGFDEQLDEDEYTEDEQDLDAQILEEMENDELYDEEEDDRAPKIANTFENIVPVRENPAELQNFDNAQAEDDLIEEESEFFDDSFGGTDIDLSLLDSVPLVEDVPADFKTAALEEENIRLRQQLAQLENERLKQQIAEQTKKQTNNTVAITKAGGAVVTGSATTKDTQPKQEHKELPEKERKQRQRWQKYANMTTRELWKYVYRFMNMAGVEKEPVKAKILVEEFGAHNIKRLEATYIMATKDGYTC